MNPMMNRIDRARGILASRDHFNPASVYGPLSSRRAKEALDLLYGWDGGSVTAARRLIKIAEEGNSKIISAENLAHIALTAADRCVKTRQHKSIRVALRRL